MYLLSICTGPFWSSLTFLSFIFNCSFFLIFKHDYKNITNNILVKNMHFAFCEDILSGLEGFYDFVMIEVSGTEDTRRSWESLNDGPEIISISFLFLTLRDLYLVKNCSGAKLSLSEGGDMKGLELQL